MVLLGFKFWCSTPGEPAAGPLPTLTPQGLLSAVPPQGCVSWGRPKRNSGGKSLCLMSSSETKETDESGELRLLLAVTICEARRISGEAVG